MTRERECACKRTRHDHGTTGGYFVDRCRCDQCSEAARIYRKRAKWRAHTGRSGLIDAAPTIAHVERLIAAGWTINQVGERSGVNPAHIGYIIGRSSKTDRAKKVYRKTAAAILTIPTHVGPDSGYVDATGTKRRIHALMAIGWTFAKIAAHLDLDERSVRQVLTFETVHASTRTRYAEVYDALWGRPAPTRTVDERRQASRARNAALRNGWPPPLAWDDDLGPHGIDNPAATPHRMRPEASLVSLDEIEWLADAGETAERICERIGTKRNSLYSRLRRSGRDDLWRKITRMEAA